MIDLSILSQVGLFEDLSKSDLGFLATRMSRRHYARGQLVFMRGDPGSAIYVVEEGQVKVLVTSQQGDQLILDVLGPGETFGELALLDGTIRSTDAIAQRSSSLLVLHRDDFLPFVTTRPEVATRLLSRLGSRLERVTKLAENEAFLDVQARLARVLLDLCRPDHRSGENWLVDCPKVTQLDLAGMVGASRRSVNKWLGYYQRQGLIRRQNGYITLLQPELLRRHAA